MKCQRCGLCCVTMPVAINVRGRARMKPGDVACPHLSFEGTVASCAVHDQPFFSKPSCPCHVYGNGSIDPDFYPKLGKPCSVGALIQGRGGLLVLRHDFQRLLSQSIEEREEACPDICPWAEATE